MESELLLETLLLPPPLVRLTFLFVAIDTTAPISPPTAPPTNVPAPGMMLPIAAPAAVNEAPIVLPILLPVVCSLIVLTEPVLFVDDFVSDDVVTVPEDIVLLVPLVSVSEEV